MLWVVLTTLFFDYVFRFVGRNSGPVGVETLQKMHGKRSHADLDDAEEARLSIDWWSTTLVRSTVSDVVARQT